MAEATEQLTGHTSPLTEKHKQLGAKMREDGAWLVPASYNEAAAEYEVVRDGGAGLIDLSTRGRVEVSGAEAVQFLNGLITNDVKTLEEGAWMLAAFPNVQGRLIAATRVLRLAGDRFLFDTESATHEQLLKTLGRFTLAGDFRVTDLTNELALISLQGASASQTLSATLGSTAARVERGRVICIDWKEQPLYLIRATHTAEDGFDLFVSATEAASVWDALSANGAEAVGFDALDILRVEAGQPRYGVDMDETNVVLEAVPDDAVSFTKGCYIGQEIIARIHWRGHVAKKLAGLVVDEPVGVKSTDKVITPEGKEIGRLTSTVFSPRLDQIIALGYLKYDYLAPGTKVRVRSGEAELAARVVELPFVRGSWYEAGQSLAETGA